MAILDSKVPAGRLEDKWDNHKFDLKLVNPANKRKFTVIVVGTGLAGASAAASLGELGYNVMSFCFQDSPRRAHSIAAQGGINANKNYPNDGDSTFRLFYDTIKGGDFRAREANVYRLAQLSSNIIDQCVAQGVPFARDYGGQPENRSFGGAQVSRTFYARGQTGQQLLLGAYGALSRQIKAGKVKLLARREMSELVVADGRARGIVCRNLVSGEIESYAADAVVLASGGYGNVFYLSTNAMGSNASAVMQVYRKGALLANPCFTQIHPTCIPVSGDHQSKLTLMSESLRNDGRVWAPEKKGDKRSPDQIPENERDYFLERKYPAFGNMVPRDVASRNVKEACDHGKGVGNSGQAVYLDFAAAIRDMGGEVIEAKYGNLFEMYEHITAENPYQVPMKIYPATHYTMGGLWVDYNLMTAIPGLFALGEANFSDHGANRLGASALMQGLADGYFVIPMTIGGYLAEASNSDVKADDPVFEKAENDISLRIRKLLDSKGEKTPDEFHRQLGRVVWEYCGMARNAEGLKKMLEIIPEIRDDFRRNLKTAGSADEFNQELDKAGRTADFIDLAEVMATDALAREESCGGHFREEYQTEEGEARRNDEDFAHVSAWEYQGEGRKPVLRKEPLEFERVKLSQRSYK